MIMKRLAAAAGFLSIALLAAHAALAADTFKVDTVHSSVVFKVKHMNTSYAWGRFNDISGTFSLDDQDPAQSTLNFVVKTGSVDTGNQMRDRHLKSPDFFNAAQYATISFKSKSVAKAGDAYEVTGDLTLHGVTKPVTAKLTRTGMGKGMRGAVIAGIEANFTIKQTEFGMSKMVGPQGVGDEVWVNVSIEAGKQ